MKQFSGKVALSTGGTCSIGSVFRWASAHQRTPVALADFPGAVPTNEETTAEDNRHQFDVNFDGVVSVTRAVVIGMNLRAKGGVILNVVSPAGQRGGANAAVHCPTKAAAISITQSFARKLFGDGIIVKAIASGVVDAPTCDTVDGLFAGYEDLAVVEKKKLVGVVAPLGHMGRSEEIADPCVFPASWETGCFTVQILNVDGGNRKS